MTVMHTPSTHNLPAADGIRGLACLIVLIVHGVSFFWIETQPLLRGGGKYGVWLFFVLSAFLLTLRLQQRGFGEGSLLDYAAGRCLRILPLFLLSCLLYYLAGYGINSLTALRDALLFRVGFIHFWTIPVEFKFYFLLPPLAWAAIKVQHRFGTLGLLLTAVLILLVLQVFWPYWLMPENSPDTRWYLGSFLFGMLGALLLPWVRRQPRALLATPYALLTLGILVMALPGTRSWLFSTPLSDNLFRMQLYLSLLWGVFVLLLIDGDGIIGRLLRSRALTFLGLISYSTYLFHFIIVARMAQHWPHSIPGFAGALTISVAAGALGYFIAERPLDNLRKRLFRSKISP